MLGKRAYRRNEIYLIQIPGKTYQDFNLGRLKKRLEAIAAGNIGGTAPIRSQWEQELEDVLRTLLQRAS